MQYQIPQFIEIEDKIIGPLTLKQFIYIAIGFFITFLTFFIIIFKVWVVIAIISTFISLIFAFFSFNGRDFVHLVSSYIKYIKRPKKIKKKDILNKEILEESIKNNSISNLNESLNTSKKPLKNEPSFIQNFLRSFESKEDKYEIIKKITGEKEVARQIDY